VSHRPIRLRIAALGAVLALGAVAACGDDDDAAPTTTEVTATTAGPETTVAEGYQQEGEDGDYTVTFPSKPDSEEQSTQLPDGTEVPYTIYTWTDPESGQDRALAAAVIAYPEGTDVNLQNAQDSVVKSFPDSQLLTTDAINRQQFDGLSFEIDLGDDSSYISEIYKGDARLYQLVYAGKDISSDDADARAFFDSLQFTEGG
jgi:hypothetical protein